MANIVYNVTPKHPMGEGHVHWLVSIVELVREKAFTNAIFRISRVSADIEKTSYSIKNSTTKTKAVLYSKCKEIFVEIQKLKNIETGSICKPDYETVSVEKYAMTETGFCAAAREIIVKLEDSTIYETKQYSLITFSTNDSKVDNQTVFLGGKIAVYVYDAIRNVTKLIIESDDCIKRNIILNLKLNGKITPENAVGRYVIIKDQFTAYCFHKSLIGMFYKEI